MSFEIKAINVTKHVSHEDKELPEFTNMNSLSIMGHTSERKTALDMPYPFAISIIQGDLLA
jgi:hypothetical protein